MLAGSPIHTRLGFLSLTRKREGFSGDVVHVHTQAAAIPIPRAFFHSRILEFHADASPDFLQYNLSAGVACVTFAASPRRRRFPFFLSFFSFPGAREHLYARGVRARDYGAAAPRCDDDDEPGICPRTGPPVCICGR